MTRERFEEIFETVESDWEGDNAFKGCVIIAKYTDEIIGAAEHDVIYSEEIDALIEAGITEEDVAALAKLNWHIGEYGCLECFV